MESLAASKLHTILGGIQVSRHPWRSVLTGHFWRLVLTSRPVIMGWTARAHESS